MFKVKSIDRHEIRLSSYLILAIGGFCTNLVGMGLGRFSYTPILVIYKTQGWLSLSQADYLGFINFMAYLLGSYASLNWLKNTLHLIIGLN